MSFYSPRPKSQEILASIMMARMNGQKVLVIDPQGEYDKLRYDLDKAERDERKS